MGAALSDPTGASFHFSTENSFSRAAMSVATMMRQRADFMPWNARSRLFREIVDRSREGAERIHMERTRQVTTP